MSKKKVTAPLTYNPGKGRPKEYLAYLNWQEMQELQRINGGNMERGPGGLPSFPPKGAMSGSSAKSPASTSKSKGAGSKSTGGGMKSGPGATGSGKTPARASPYGRTVESSRGVGTQKSAAQKAGMNARDAQFKQIAESTRASSALKKSAAAGPDLSKSGIKTLNVGPMGTPVNVRTGQAGSQIKGVIKDIAGQMRVPTTPARESGPIPAHISKEEYGWSATGPSRLSAHQGMGIYGGELVRQGENLTQKEIDTLLNVNTSLDQGLNKQVRALSPEMRRNAAILSSAAVLQGMDPKLAIGMGAIESGLGKNIGKRTARYQGLTQMGPGEFKQYADETSKALGRRDPWASAQSGIAYMSENKKKFSDKYGRSPTLGDVYGMHQQGFSGYTKLIDNPNKLAKDVVKPSHVKQNLPSSMRGQWRTITAGEFANVIAGYPEKSLTRLSGVPSEPSTKTANVVPAASQEAGSFNWKTLVPDSVKVGIAEKYAEDAGKKLAGYYRQGIEGLRDYFGQDVDAPAGGAKPGTKMFTLAPGDVYGPKYVSPEAQQVMEQQDKLNKRGVKIAKTVTGPVGRAFTAADALRKVFTGKTTTEATADLKRAYMQATPTQRAELEKAYPNLTKFAADAGVDPQLPMSNYTDWSRANRLAETSGRGDGREQGISGGIADITSTAGTGATPSETSSTASTASARPYIYYEWDLGINVPSPGEPKYTEYQKYLKERADAQKALGLV